jgi:hypothetical protein
MKRREQRRQGKGALELIEEAVHLLRLAPARVIVCYYVGAAPFLLGLLYFWADMSQSAFARERCGPAALGLSLLFLWMKTWQAVYARLLRCQVSGAREPEWTLRRFLRITYTQSVVQPSGLLALPVAALIVLPAAWTYAFYQNIIVVGEDEQDGLRGVLRRAARLTVLWPGQNHLILLSLSGFGLIVGLNLAIAFVVAPELLRMLLGVETAMTMGGWTFFNTTFHAVVWGLAWLCLDPLIKAVYVLRCFYGESLQTGEDLKVELRRVRFSRLAGVTALVLLGLSLFTGEARAAEGQGGGVAPPPVESGELSRKIDDVLSQREYAWRLPRVAPVEDEERGFIALFFDELKESLRTAAVAIGRLVSKVFDWLDRLRSKLGFRRTGVNSSGFGLGLTNVLMYTLMAVAGCIAAVLLYRLWKGRRRRRVDVQAEAVAAQPDLRDENIVADQLPEDGWLKLAREMMDRGELRLALRALYLASLAHLGDRELIRIARYKSNRDYERELRWRARAVPDLQDVFAENVSIFDRVWYGAHDVTSDLLAHFQQNFERIRAC